MKSNEANFLDAYRSVLHRGTTRVVRGSETIDLPNAVCHFNTNDSPCSSFVDRKFNLNYAKQEMLWYLRADEYDDSICEHAKAWQKLKQENNYWEGSFFSNYGQYIFARQDNPQECGEGKPSQFEYVVEQLKADKFTRRASIVLLQPYHLFPENIDTVCTYAINFAIYDDALRMTVHMRSNDVIFGMTNDVFCFWCLYQMVYALVAEHYATRDRVEGTRWTKVIKRGLYTHQVDSLHVYERHYDMIRKIVGNSQVNEFPRIEVPFVSADEVRGYLSSGTMDGEFGRWLNG